MDWRKTEIAYNLKVLTRRKIPCFIEELRLLSELRSSSRGKSHPAYDCFRTLLLTILISVVFSCIMDNGTPLSLQYWPSKKRSDE